MKSIFVVTINAGTVFASLFLFTTEKKAEIFMERSPLLGSKKMDEYGTDEWDEL